MATSTTTLPSDSELPARQPKTARTRIGLIVAGSMAAGMAAAALLVAAPLVPAEEHRSTGMVLLGFALGWALLAVLSVRFSDQPQRWAAAPAAFMSVVGVALLSGSAAVRDVLSWMWPLALLVLVVWMFLQVRRALHSRGARWLLYPVLAVLWIAAIGGDVRRVLRAVGGVAPAAAGAVVDADPGVAGDGGGDPAEVGGGGSGAGFHDDGRAAGAGAVQVQSMPADLDQLAGRGVGLGVERLPRGFVAAAEGGDPQHGEDGVQQPSCASAVQRPSGPQGHPDREHEQGRRPHPAGASPARWRTR